MEQRIAKIDLNDTSILPKLNVKQTELDYLDRKIKVNPPKFNFNPRNKQFEKSRKGYIGFDNYKNYKYKLLNKIEVKVLNNMLFQNQNKSMANPLNIYKTLDEKTIRKSFQQNYLIEESMKHENVQLNELTKKLSFSMKEINQKFLNSSSDEDTILLPQIYNENIESQINFVKIQENSLNLKKIIRKKDKMKTKSELIQLKKNYTSDEFNSLCQIQSERRQKTIFIEGNQILSFEFFKSKFYHHFNYMTTEYFNRILLALDINPFKENEIIDNYHYSKLRKLLFLQKANLKLTLEFIIKFFFLHCKLVNYEEVYKLFQLATDRIIDGDRQRILSLINDNMNLSGIINIERKIERVDFRNLFLKNHLPIEEIYKLIVTNFN